MAVRKIRLWDRDLHVLREIERSPKLTSQIARLCAFPNQKKCAERLGDLFRAGVVHRTPYFHVAAKQGKPEFLYGKRPLHPRTHVHTIAVSEVHVRVAEWLRTTTYGWDFYYAHEIQTSGGIIPDATLVVRKAEKTGLFFFEVDNGTESVTSTAGYSLAGKFDAYASYFDSGAYLRDFEWAGSLRGFRIALVVPAGRLRSVHRLVAREGLDFLLLTSFDLLKEGMHRPVWLTHDGVRVDLLGRRGDLVGEKIEPTVPTLASESG